MSSCNKKKLEFCVFLINILAEYLDLLTPEIYKKLNDSQILDENVIPFDDGRRILNSRYNRYDERARSSDVIVHPSTILKIFHSGTQCS